MSETVAVDVADRIAWGPVRSADKRDCMNPTLNLEMLDVIEGQEFRKGVDVSGGEGSARSAGMDLKEFFREK